MRTTTCFRLATIAALTVTMLSGVLLFSDATARPAPTEEAMKQAERFKDNGGSDESAAAIEHGLGWLALHQSPDGSWSMSEFNKWGRATLEGRPFGNCGCKPDGGASGNDIAGTAFGVLPFLGAGYTHKPGNDPKSKVYARIVSGGLGYLLRKQAKTGDFGGSSMYSHALATLAVCEGYALTKDAKLKASAQAAINFIVNAQDPKGGGWRYTPRTAGDMSVSGWQLAALKSAQQAGLTVPKNAFDKAEEFWTVCEVRGKSDDPKTKGKLTGYVYFPAVQKKQATPTMTAVGLLGRLYLGAKAEDADVRDGLEMVKAKPPSKQEGCYQEYYVNRLMWKLGGEDWKGWNLGPDGKDGLRDVLVKRQDDGKTANHPHQLGSWEGTKAHGGGRLMATSLSLLSLEAPGEQLPMYRREKDK